MRQGFWREDFILMEGLSILVRFFMLMAIIILAVSRIKKCTVTALWCTRIKIDLQWVSFIKENRFILIRVLHIDWILLKEKPCMQLLEEQFTVKIPKYGSMAKCLIFLILNTSDISFISALILTTLIRK